MTWVESHDTYCNNHESAHLTDEQIRMGWVFLASRQHGTPLFFSRPAGSTRTNYWGNNLVGPRGNDEFKHPEVVAANRFRAVMAGEPERIFTTTKGEVAQVARGNKGAALVNFTDKARNVKMDTLLPDGTYTDEVHNATFVVKGGKLSGKLQPLTSYLLKK